MTNDFRHRPGWKFHSNILAAFFIAIIFPKLLFAQQDQLMKSNELSQDATLLKVNADIPVNPFTGKVNVNIPIRDINVADISIPISLSYNQDGNRVNAFPGWVGLGWNLNAGGAISRIVNGIPDETLTRYDIYGYSPTPNTQRGFYYRCADLTTANLLSDATLKSTAFLTSEFLGGREQASLYSNYPPNDAQWANDYSPDEFSFNFLGYSGKFYRGFGDCEWKVISDDAIKIESVSFLPTTSLDFQNELSSVVKWDHQQIFYSFVLVTSDGFRYTFGSNQNSIEFSRSIRDANANPAIASSWFLTKIQSPNGHSVSLNYNNQEILDVEIVSATPGYTETRDKYQVTTVYRNSGDVEFQKYFAYSDELYDVFDSLGYGSVTNLSNPLAQNIAAVKQASIDNPSSFQDLQISLTNLGNYYSINKTLYVPTVGPVITSELDFFNDEELELKRVAYGTKRAKTAALQQNYIDRSLTWNGPSGVVGIADYDAFESYALADNMSSVRSAFRTNGNITYPVYLKSIVTDNLIISFQRSASKQLNYHEDDLDIHISVDPSMYNQAKYPLRIREGENYWKPEHLQPSQLDRITMLTQEGNVLAEYGLEYTNNASERLKLLSLSQIGLETGDKITHDFSYNSLSLPPYLSDAIDHWGYYNGKTQSSSSAWSSISGGYTISNKAAYKLFRDPDPTGVSQQAELLTSIQYPTGGTTSFTFEPNTYSKYVKENKQGLTPLTSSQTGGGVRLKEVRSSASGSADIVKKYFYVNGNTNNESTLNGLSSSGISYGLPRYEWNSLNRSYDDINFTYDVFSSSTVNTVTSGNGLTVSYPHVVVLSPGNGYEKLTYTSHNDGTAYYDSSPENTFYGGNEFLFGNRDKLRGQLKLREVFNEANQVLQSTQIDYTIFDRHPDVYQSYFQNFLPDRNREFVFGDFVILKANYTKVHGTMLLPEKVTEKIYSTEGDNAFMQTITNNTYNTNGFLKTAEMTSAGKTYRTVNYYADELTGSFMTDLVSDHRIGEVVKSENFVNGILTGYSLKNYSDISGLLRVVSIGNYQNGQLASKEFYQQFSGNNLVQQSLLHDIPRSILWSYNNSLPVAIIENATYLDVTNALGTSTVEDINLSRTPDYNDLEAHFQTLRNALPNAMISTYSYDVLHGDTSSSDPTGLTLFKQYDEFGRLQKIIDHDNKTLQEFDYNTTN